MRYGLGAAFLKNYVPANSEERMSIMTNVIVSLIISGLPFLAIFYFFRLDLSYILFGVVKPSYVVIMGVIVFFDTIWSIPMLAFRAENRPRLFISLSLLNVGITLLCNLLFIIILKMSIGSIFLSNLIASSLLFILVIPYIIKRSKIASLSLYQVETYYILCFSFYSCRIIRYGNGGGR